MVGRGGGREGRGQGGKGSGRCPEATRDSQPKGGSMLGLRSKVSPEPHFAEVVFVRGMESRGHLVHQSLIHW